MQKQKQRGVHPADLPENRKRKCPDYLKCDFASDWAKEYARLLDEREEQNRNRR